MPAAHGPPSCGVRAPGEGSPDGTMRRRYKHSADHHARDEPFEVPVPRGCAGLVEVVEVEDEFAFRGGIEAEVADVRVTACRDHDPRVRVAGEVHGHQPGRPSVERERVLEHALHAQGHQFLVAVFVLFADMGDGVTMCRAPLGQRTTRRGPAQLAAAGIPIGTAQRQLFANRCGGGLGRHEVILDARTRFRNRPTRLMNSARERGACLIWEMLATQVRFRALPGA